MRLVARRLLLAVAVTAVVAGCTSGAATPSFLPHPTDQQARDELTLLFNWAKAGDFAMLCAHGSLNCEQNLEDFSAKASAPTTPPLVVGSRDVPDGDRSQGGRLLEVCGLDSLGRSYQTTHLFSGTGNNFVVIEAVFWVPINYSESATTVASGLAAGPEWDACPRGQ